MFGGLSVDVLAEADPDNNNDQLVVSDRVDDSISAHPKTIPILHSSKLLATRRPRVSGQRMNTGHDALTVLLLTKGLDLLGRGRLDQNPITCHAA
jgi:hypothetical protein